MAVIIQIPENTYNPIQAGVTPKVFTFQRTVPVSASITEIVFQLTKVSWPLGLCLRVNVQFPDGSTPGWAGFDGGTTPAKDGSQTVTYGVQDASGLLPSGQYTITFEVWQAITTALTVSKLP